METVADKLPSLLAAHRQRPSHPYCSQNQQPQRCPRVLHENPEPAEAGKPRSPQQVGALQSVARDTADARPGDDLKPSPWESRPSRSAANLVEPQTVPPELR